MSMGIEQIIAFRDSGEIWQAPKLPCHTQAVERMIKVVAEPSLCVAGLEERDVFVMNELKSRNKMSKLESKSDFKI